LYGAVGYCQQSMFLKELKDRKKKTAKMG